MTGGRRAGMAVAGLVLVGALAGCVESLPNFHRYEGPIAIQRDAGTLLFAVCTDIDASSILAEERNVGRGEDWVSFVEASGQAQIPAGSIFSAGDLPVGLHADVATEPGFAEGTEYSFLLVAGDSSLLAGFAPGARVPQDEWLHPDGSTSAEPCERPDAD